MRRRALRDTFECETRLDRLDTVLLDMMHRAGLRAMSFGVVSLPPHTLKKVGRRPIPKRTSVQFSAIAAIPGS